MHETQPLAVQHRPRVVGLRQQADAEVLLRLFQSFSVEPRLEQDRRQQLQAPVERLRPGVEHQDGTAPGTARLDAGAEGVDRVVELLGAEVAGAAAPCHRRRHRGQSVLARSLVPVADR